MKIDYEDIIDEMQDNAKYYDLGGVEFTMEDAKYVEELMHEGFTQEEAIDKALDSIKEVLET